VFMFEEQRPLESDRFPLTTADQVMLTVGQQLYPAEVHISRGRSHCSLAGGPTPMVLKACLAK
jgi:hypothetical protein